MELKNSKEWHFTKEVKHISHSEIVIGYARVSTLDQATNSYAIEQQIKRLEQTISSETFH